MIIYAALSARSRRDDETIDKKEALLAMATVNATSS